MWTLLTILFVIVCGTVSELQPPCEFGKSVELVHGAYGNLTFGSNETIVDPESHMERGCVCLKGTCARKCCPFGMMYKYDEKKCVKETIRFDPPVLDESYKFKERFNATTEFIFITGKMVCNKDAGERRLRVYPDTLTFNLTTDGKFFIEDVASIPSTIIYEPDKYCVDTFVSDDVQPHPNGLVCYLSNVTIDYRMSISCMMISCFFILLTVAVYAWLPELRNLHGMVLMAYLICFFVGFLFLATMQLLIQVDKITGNLCIILTFITYFSLLSAFFWLNIMCYDIWWTFSGKRAHGRSGSQGKHFMYYAIYAFGVPTALTILLGIMEFGTNLPRQHPLLPKLRLQGCFLYGNSKLLYLYGPIVLLCVANMTFFGLTAFKIWKIKKETKMLRGKESSTHDQDRKDTQRFTLYVKLFTVMGINWILEVVSSFYPDADFFWQFSDAYNVLLGLIIFIIFVCKKKTWMMIKKRYRQLTGKDPLSRTQTISTTRTQPISQDEIQMKSVQK